MTSERSESELFNFKIKVIFSSTYNSVFDQVNLIVAVCG